MKYFHTDRLMAEREELEAITLAQGKGFALFDGSIEGTVTTNRQNIVVPKSTHLKIPIYAARILLQSNHIAVFLPDMFRPSKQEYLMVDPKLMNMKRLGFRAFYAIARFFYALLKQKPKLCLVAETKQFSPELPEIKQEALDYLKKILTHFWLERRLELFQKGVACDTHALRQNPTLTSEVVVSVAREELDALRIKLSSEEESLLNHALLESQRHETYFRKIKPTKAFHAVCSEEINKEELEADRRAHIGQETGEVLPLR